MSRSVPRGFFRLGSLAPFLVAALFPPSLARADDLAEELLEKKYKHGDYGFYFGVQDPWDAQFDEVSPGVYDSPTYAYPMGFKMRFRWKERFYLEGDASYARRGEEPVEFVSTLAAPEIDALTVCASLQMKLRRSGMLRPYVGAGGVFVSISRDQVVDLAPAIPELEDSADRYQLGTWSEMDVGIQAHLGVDIRVGKRAFPFVEYRHLFGTLGIQDITVGGFSFSPEDLAVSSTYEYAGPIFMAGLKIHF